MQTKTSCRAAPKKEPSGKDEELARTHTHTHPSTAFEMCPAAFVSPVCTAKIQLPGGPGRPGRGRGGSTQADAAS